MADPRPATRPALRTELALFFVGMLVLGLGNGAAIAVVALIALLWRRFRLVGRALFRVVLSVRHHGAWSRAVVPPDPVAPGQPG